MFSEAVHFADQFLTQAQPKAAAGWSTIVLLMIIVVILAKLNGAIFRILSIALTMGIVGLFLAIVNISFINSIANTVSGWMGVGNTSFTPIVMIAISAGVRAAQIFKDTNGKLADVMAKVPDVVELGIIVLATAIGGIAMAGAPAWKNWLTSATDIVAVLFKFGMNTIELVGPQFGLSL